MSAKSAGAKATSHDATVTAVDGGEPQAEQEYLKAREHDLVEAIKKLRKKIKSTVTAVTQLERELAQVRAEQEG